MSPRPNDSVVKLAKALGLAEFLNCFEVKATVIDCPCGCKSPLILDLDPLNRGFNCGVID